MINDILVTPRRNLEQLVHTCQEALSACKNNDDPRHVYNDLRAAQGLVEHLLRMYIPMARDSKRGEP